MERQQGTQRSRSMVRHVAPVKLMEKFIEQRTISLPPILNYLPTVKPSTTYKEKKEENIEKKLTEGYCE
jgi:hypothetical protein